MTPSAGIKPGTHWWKASAVTTVPTLFPDSVNFQIFSIAALKQLYNVHIFSTFYTQGYKSDHGNINNPSKDRAVRATYKMF